MFKNISKKLLVFILLALCICSPIYTADTVGFDFGDYDTDYMQSHEQQVHDVEEAEFPEEQTSDKDEQRQVIFKDLLINLITARKFIENDQDVPAEILNNIDSLVALLNEQV